MTRTKAERQRSRHFNASLKENEIACILTVDQVEGVRDAIADMIDGLKNDIVRNYIGKDDDEVIRLHEDLEFYEGLKLRMDKYGKRARAQARKIEQKQESIDD